MSTIKPPNITSKEESSLPDTQNQRDTREIPIDKVGVKNLKFPIVVMDKEKVVQHTIATISMTVDLPMEFKGTHMSRFVEIIQNEKNEIHVDSIDAICKEMQKRFQATTSHLEMEFPYFKAKKAPVSGKPSLIDYKVKFHAVRNNDKKDFIMTVFVPVATLCPCSKIISENSAHNQRGEVRVSIRFNEMVWIEEIISTVEGCASADLYSILKREDEKYLTEKAYQNPVFVEDLVRNVVTELRKIKSVTWYTVEAENFESIHNHNAYACIESHNSINNIQERDFIINRY